MISSEVPVIFKTDSWMAVNKPGGLSVHNSEDLQNLIELLKIQTRQNRIFPAHRLDKETSGVQVVAFNEKTARELAEEFQDRNVEKFYVGVLRGELPNDGQSWNLPLTDKGEGRKNPAGLSKDRVPCETKYTILKTSRYFTLCQFQLMTGRQHQIRKHCALARHALVGDARYGDPKYNQKMANFYKTDRLFLHASSLFLGNQKLSAPIPKEFDQLIS